jgi:hypothetical protein
MLNTQIKIEHTDNYTYIGKSVSGVPTSASNWSITRIEKDSDGKIISIAHSGGVVDQIYKFDDRLTLEYK